MQDNDETLDDGMIGLVRQVAREEFLRETDAVIQRVERLLDALGAQSTATQDLLDRVTRMVDGGVHDE